MILWQRLVMKIFIVVGMVFCVSSTSAQDLPSKADGYRDSAIFNGNQNMPFKLYGVAIDWERDCLGGDLDQCMRLASAFEEGLGDLAVEIRVSLGFYLRACEKGVGEACTKAAMIIRNGEANFTNHELAQQTAERGCDVLGEQDACVVKALGFGAEQSGQAAAMIDQSCKNGSDYGCQIKASELYYTFADPQSTEQAITLFEKACRSKQAWGCAGLADAYDKGNGVRADNTQAMAAAKKGCLEGAGNTIPACSYYGHLLSKKGPLSDLKMGVGLLSSACLAGDAFACNQTGEIGWQRPIGTGIASWEVPLYFRDGCDLNNGDACFNLAGVYEAGYDQLKEHQSSMLPLLDKACGLGSTEACEKITDMGQIVELLRKRPPKVDPSLPAQDQLSIALEFADNGNYGTALNAVVRLMHEGVAEASWLLGGWLYYGYSGIFDEPRTADGLTLIENAALNRHVEAAKWISMAYWYGDGVGEDRKKALGFMSFAASSGDEMAGAIYGSMLAEPIRQDNARRKREMEEEAERRKNDWGYQISLAASRRSPPTYASSPSQGASNASWQRSQAALDKLNWNNAVSYQTGGTTACPISNPYC